MTAKPETIRSESLICDQDKRAIIATYEDAANCAADFERGKWGSEVGMMNRFHLGLDQIDWNGVASWTDFGCGTGAFFGAAEAAGRRFNSLIGIDITAAMIELARERRFQSPARFFAADLESIPPQTGAADLVTMIGVLQLCGCAPRDALAAGAKRLRAGGQIFLTTKHIGWKAFDDPAFKPDPDHSWFLWDDVAAALGDAGFEIVRHGGFLPREGEIVALKEAHTLFALGRLRV